MLSYGSHRDVRELSYCMAVVVEGIITAFSYLLDADHPFRASIVASIPHHLIMIVSECVKCSVIYLSCRIEVKLSCGGSVVARSSFCRSIPWRANRQNNLQIYLHRPILRPHHDMIIIES